MEHEVKLLWKGNEKEGGHGRILLSNHQNSSNHLACSAINIIFNFFTSNDVYSNWKGKTAFYCFSKLVIFFSEHRMNNFIISV